MSISLEQIREFFRGHTARCFDDEDDVALVADAFHAWLKDRTEFLANAVVEEIDAFEDVCRAEEYTDPGDAWDVFYKIREMCGGTNP